jgi:hypothetical protein
MGKIVVLKFNNEDDAEAWANIARHASKGLTSTGFIESVEVDYHTPHELYQHRYELYRALVFSSPYRLRAWRSKLHADGTMFDNSFIVGINLGKLKSPERRDITYHLPLSWWDKFEGVIELDNAPEYDGATPEEGLERLAAYVDYLANLTRPVYRAPLIDELMPE